MTDEISFDAEGNIVRRTLSAEEMTALRDLTDDERATMSRGHCPDCNHRGFVLGPRGGPAINISCGGCDNRFNVTTFGYEVVMGHRLPKES